MRWQPKYLKIFSGLDIGTLRAPAWSHQMCRIVRGLENRIFNISEKKEGKRFWCSDKMYSDTILKKENCEKFFGFFWRKRKMFRVQEQLFQNFYRKVSKSSRQNFIRIWVFVKNWLNESDFEILVEDPPWEKEILKLIFYYYSKSMIF